jgi:hypothetical protein
MGADLLPLETTLITIGRIVPLCMLSHVLIDGVRHDANH